MNFYPKLGGEVTNMKKREDKLQTGFDQVTKLQQVADKTLVKLSEEFSLSEYKNSSNAQSSKDIYTCIPLRSFIFDVKPKKQLLINFCGNMYKNV